MKVSRFFIVMILLIFIVFRLLLVPIMQANDEEDYLMYFVTTTDSYLAEYDGDLQDIEYYEQIKKIVTGDMGYAYVLDDSAKIIIHPNQDVIGSNINDLDIPEITASIRELEYPGEECIIEYQFEGITRIARFYKDDYSRIIVITDTYHTPSLIEMIIK